ncbi:MAG: T9SS type A sorting domain-containing protein [Phycisphaerae bacterium]|nr:T9SS type A sorting domain-containing protein [Saprospiraceae bacterium]
MNFQTLRTQIFPLVFFSLLAFSAQSQCLYTLVMHDNFGDGWNGGILTINSGGNPVAYTLNDTTDNGMDSTLTFMIMDGAPLTLSYVAGNYPGEVSFKIYDNTGSLLFESAAPATGNLFFGVGNCITCGKPLAFAVENVWDNRAKLRWQPNNGGTTPPVSWRVIYGLQGFSPSAGQGDTLDVLLPKITIPGLQKKTWYDAYVQQYCDVAGGYSEIVGPISFQTYWTNDVGIADVIAPVNSCDLGYDSVKVILANYGAAPQSLFKFRYSVNGTDAPVVPPADGFYTGILGKDSSTVIAFETLTDFSAPGEYRIDVFTELTGDEDILNDTFTYYVNNRLKPNYVQQFEVWDGGWTPGGQKPSWQFGTPNKPSIPAAASGQNAWVTNLTGSVNLSEFSYLESPCFDFSDLTADPAIEFSLIHELQSTYDLAWLEMSLDGGQNWEKIGEIGEGKNWYKDENQFLGLGEGWSGRSNGWVTARHALPNSAGESEVHLRFVVATVPFFSSGGVGIDDVRIFKSFAKDLAGLSVYTLGETEECGLPTDQIIFSFTNFGNQAQSGVKVAYSINGGTPVIQNIAGSVATDQGITHTFSVPFDSRDGAFEIKCWTALNGDQATSNDTVTYFIDHQPKPVPFQENFEAYTLPPTDWTYDPTFGFSVTDQHNNISKVLAFNLYSGNTEFTADMPRMGNISQGDSLRFTYRITNFANQGQTPTILQGSKIEIQVSTDCGDTYQTVFTISGLNHSPTVAMRTRKISLDAYAGQAIKIRFHGIWGAGDFWVDLDNINLLSCPADMDLTAGLTPATPGLSDGAATAQVGIGNPPYQYEWSDGSTEQTATDLAAGNYTVTVTDAHGCTDALSISLGSSSAADLGDFAKISLYPNPTSGVATFQATFGRLLDAQIEILNPLGQRVWYISANKTDQLSQSFDLGSFPSGLYLVKLSAEGKTLTRKLLKE